jgi:hypothetical protein
LSAVLLIHTDPPCSFPYNFDPKSPINVSLHRILCELSTAFYAALRNNASFIIKSVWTGKNEFGKQVATGVYFYRLEAAGKCITHKMLLLK